jgi:hypothetical protein
VTASHEDVRAFWHVQPDGMKLHAYNCSRATRDRPPF